MANNIKLSNWFSGKALANASAAMQLIADSEAQGYWIPGASRKVRAALTKSNIAAKIVRGTGLDNLPYDYTDEIARAAHNSAFAVFMMLMYGSHERAIDFDVLRAAKLTVAQRAAVDACERFAADFRPTCDLMAQLDALRPKPVFTSVGVSPTLTATLADLGIKLTPGAFGVAELKFKQVGNEWHAYLVWPQGTVHGTSRHKRGRGTHAQCEACGHAIKNSYNWVPLWAKDTQDVTHSLWVGRDCARSLFGIKMTGDLVLAEPR